MTDNRESTQMNEEVQEKQEPRMYTQEEVENIVRKRLNRERMRNERETVEHDADREKALDARELKITAREKLQEAGMPLNLADVLRYEDEDSLEAAISAVKDLGYKKKDQESSGSWGQRVSGGKSVPPGDQFRQVMGLDRKG